MENSRFLKACYNQEVDFAPVWCMRQAGRYMKEYQHIRNRYSFITMVKTPDLATKITLQPIQEFDFDAAILFSDILVVVESMGIPYRIVEDRGPVIDRPVNGIKDIDRLYISDPRESLEYVMKAISLVKKELPEKPLIGFSGSPWTLATYMVEGSGTKNFLKIKKMFYTDFELFQGLMDKITEQVTAYLLAQAEAGVDALQIFDSWGGILTHHAFDKASLRYIKKVIVTLKRKTDIPVILFVKGGYPYLRELKNCFPDVVSLDWTINLQSARQLLGKQIAVQGNLDPAALCTNADSIRREVFRILRENNGQPGHIFNLGHGILPETPEENVQVMVDAVREYSLYQQ
jgi:uroporphyrinogen decarboxylase